MGILKSLFHNKPGSGEAVLKNRAVLALIIAAVFCGLLGLLGTAQGQTAVAQMETETVPLGYFELTVSPAEAYANVGEPIEIRCSIDCLINTVVEVSSVDVLLFDSYDSIIREQAMTKDSYWSARTEYTIVGDEAYYQIRLNFSILHDPSGEHSEYGVHSFPIHVLATQMETGTIPLGYFRLTVSPTEVYANVGEPIEIHCTTDVLINDAIEINSIDVVLFDSYDSIIREQAMTKDYSWWSANTVCTIVGDEAYYQIKINFTFPYDEPGEYSEYGLHSFPITVNQE